MCIRDSPDILGERFRQGQPGGIGYFLGGLAADRLAAAPVSYTHLDVYKRQDGDHGRRIGGVIEGQHPCGTRLCLQSLLWYTLVPADAEKGLRAAPASTCSAAEGCADGRGS